MKEDILSYLKKRPNAEFLFLSLVALIGFCLLFFKPYRVYDWVEQNEQALMWGEMGILTLMIVLLMHYVSELRKQVETNRWRENDSADDVQMFNFYDERGELKLSVKPENLYFIESADNYVKIHYQNLGKIQMLMIRSSMKNIEWRCQGTQLVRCHRSYLANLGHVQMLKRVDGEVYLDFNDEHVAPIPVGKAYADQVMSFFAQ